MRVEHDKNESGRMTLAGVAKETADYSVRIIMAKTK
jgi:hypothetical protein